MQDSALYKIYKLEKQVLETKDKQLIEDWRKLQTSDHFYYMCTKYFNDGDVHKYFNPYESPYDAFINYMNIVQDLELRLERYEKTENPRPLTLNSDNIYKDNSVNNTEVRDGY